MTDNKAVIHKKGASHPDDSDKDPLDLLDVKRRPVDICEAETGAVNVEQTDAAQQQNENEQGPVEIEDQTSIKLDHGFLVSPPPVSIPCKRD